MDTVSARSCSPAALDERDIDALRPLLTHLEESLQRELGALQDADVDRLIREVETKRELLQALDRLLHESGLGARLAAARDSRTGPWGALQDHLRRCRDLNESVGSAISSSLRHNEQLLRALGHAPATELYGRAANHPPPASGRSLATC